MSSKVDVRESMRALPAFIQPFLTWMTGKPLWGQEPVFRQTAFTQVFTTVLSIFGGMAVATWALGLSVPVALVVIPLAWLFIVGGARKMQVTICHQGAHHAFSGSKRFDEWFVEFFTTFMMVDHFKSYVHEHVLIHHTKKLATEVDPDCRFLLQLGFEPGAEKSQLKRHLVRTMFSPGFHFKFLSARIRANFISAPLPRRAMAMLYSALVVATVAYYGLYAEFIVAMAIPLTVLYHVAALLNFSSLHYWLRQPDPNDSAKKILASLTAGRFVGEAAPSADLTGVERVSAWSAWTARMLFLHLPTRIAVLAGDLPVHDYHHRYPRCAEWPNFFYTRQRDIERGTPGWNEPYLEVWGLPNAIDSVMGSLSVVPKQPAAESQLSAQETRQYIVQL